MIVRNLAYAVSLCILTSDATNGVLAAPEADLCKQVPQDVVRTLLFGGDGGKPDSWSDHPTANIVTRKWVATIDHPTQSRNMSLSVQNYGGEAAARAAMAKLPQGGIPTGALSSEAVIAGSNDDVDRPDDF